MFENKHRLLINQDLIFRCHKLYVENETAYTSREYQWEYEELYEIEVDTSVATYYIDNQTYDNSIKIIYEQGNEMFYQGDHIVCVMDYTFHSINGLPDTYLDFNVIRYQMYNIMNDVPDSIFAEVVKLNELEYMDFLYGRD